MKKLSLKTKSGKLTAYGLSCGYIEKDRVTDLAIWHQSGCYHVGGWFNDKHYRESFKTLSAARRYARKPFHPEAK